MYNQSVIVVGAGILGCSLASELARRGCKVTVLDAGETGSGTTAASFAWVNSNDKEPADYFNLNFLGLAAHERWAAVRSARPWFHQIGNIQVAPDDTALALLEEKVERARGRSYAAEMLTLEGLSELEPALDLGAAAGGALFAREGWVDVPVACADLLHEILVFGGTFLPFHRVIAVDPAGTVEAVDPAGAVTTYTADVVALTAGNGIQPIAASLGIDFPILPVTGAQDAPPSSSSPLKAGGSGSSRKRVDHPTVGLTCTTSPVVGGPRHMLRFEGVTMRPARNGGLTLTDHPTASQWDVGDPRLLAVPDALLTRARTVVPALQGAFVNTVTLGNRVLPVDGITIADWIGPEGNLYAVATHSGVTLAPHLAETVTEEIRTGARHESLASFGLGRFDQATVA
jgi:glycine/D-amino acid oxidase-like deaminating enzyme